LAECLLTQISGLNTLKTDISAQNSTYIISVNGNHYTQRIVVEPSHDNNNREMAAFILLCWHCFTIARVSLCPRLPYIKCQGS